MLGGDRSPHHIIPRCRFDKGGYGIVQIPGSASAFWLLLLLLGESGEDSTARIGILLAVDVTFYLLLIWEWESAML